jgi:hypothetical protein
MVGALGSKPHAGAVIQPQPPFLGLLARHLEPLQTPDALDPLDVHRPAGSPQHRRDPAIAVAAILRGELNDVGGERPIVGPSFRRLPLCRAMLPQHAACQPLGHVELRHDVIDAAATAGGAQKFPEAASRRISFSSVRSETALRSRSFSFSRSFSRFT